MSINKKTRLLIDQKLDELYLSLCIKNEQTGFGLMGGVAGEVLFYLNYYRYTKNKQFLEKAIQKVTEIYANFHELKKHGATLSNGTTGYAWLLQHIISQDYFELEADQILSEFDSFLLLHLITEIKKGHYDYLHGAIGIGSYYLMRYQIGNNKTHVETLVEELYHKAIKINNEFKWENRDFKTGALIANQYNLGLAHGIPSILAFLMKTHQKGIAQEKTAAMIKGIVNYLMRIKAPNLNLGCYFGYLDGDKETNPSRLAWCYGDLGVCFTLYKASLVLKDIDLKDKIIAMFIQLAGRRDLSVNLVADAELCHGSMGISHVFKKMHQLTSMPIFAETANYWLMVTFEMAKFEDGLAGFKTFKGHLKTWENNYGFLEGIAGIGLGLIAATSDEFDSWDDLLLLN